MTHVIKYKVRQRKPKAIEGLKHMRNWMDYCSPVDTLEEAEQDIANLHSYDEYYSVTGWEYDIKEVKVKWTKQEALCVN